MVRIFRSCQVDRARTGVSIEARNIAIPREHEYGRSGGDPATIFAFSTAATMIVSASSRSSL
jgi:hypothetical protein